MTPTQTVQTEEILRRLTLGESLRKICSVDWLPAIQTFLDWVAADEGLTGRYVRAKREGIDFLFDQLAELAEQSKRAETKGEIAGYRNQIDVLRWQLSKLDPKRLGDRVAVEASGPDGGPIRHAATVVVSLDPAAAAQEYKTLMDDGEPR